MKKDIEALIAEERAEIIAKYEKVRAFAHKYALQPKKLY